jgi:FkbM family methyltransferase
VRIALLHPCYWPEVRRGAERFIRELADGLLARGEEVSLITSQLARPSRTVEDGLEVVRVWRPPQRPLLRLGFEDHLTHLPFSYSALCASAADVAHAVNHVEGPLAARWGRTAGRPSVFSCMGIPDDAYLAERRLRRATFERAVHGCDATVALSDAAARTLERSFGEQVRVIPPGVDVRTFTPDPATRAETPEIICAASAAEPRKRVRLLVEAFGHVRRELPDARLVLDRPRDAALARAFQSEPGVVLERLDDRAALATAYRRAWVSALPSTFEAFGLVLAEALACGTPVAATDAGGMVEVVGRDSDVGRLFGGDDPKALARALVDAIDLCRDPRTAARCRKRAEQFSTDVCARRYAQLYRDLLGAEADRHKVPAVTSNGAGPAHNAIGRVREARRHARIVNESGRYAARELMPRESLGAYTVPPSGLTVLVRHNVREQDGLTPENWPLREVFADGAYEPPPIVDERLRTSAMPKVVDLGANVGLFGVYILGRYPQARLVGFEPDPSNLSVLRECVRRNGLGERWEVADAAVGPEAGVVSFVGGRGGRSHVAQDGDGAQSVRVVDVFPHLQGADLVKIDIEGSEWPLLADERLGSSGIGALVMEYHSLGCPEPNARRAATRLLEGAGFALQFAPDDPNPPDEPFWGCGVVWAWR